MLFRSVGFNAKTGQYLLRFSEDSFGLDVPAETITPTCEYVWQADEGELMRLDRQRLAWLQEQRIDDRVISANRCVFTCAATTCRKSAPNAAN